jgi:uncharacterized protein YbjT (DUF2867 family)
MKLVIFGASGQTGRLVVEQALKRGHQVTACVRRPDALTMEHPNLKVVMVKLDDAGTLTKAIAGADACISTLGGNSLSKRSTQFTQGISNIVAEMERLGVKRFIYMSSVGAGESRYFMGPFLRLLITGILLRIPLADHSANEDRLLKSTLKWTFIRPGSLTDGPKTGKIRHGSEFIKLTGNPKITRADVADFILDQVVGEIYVNQGVWLFGE